VYVYWWYSSDEELKFVKIGFGTDPWWRMCDYSDRWNLPRDERSLKQLEVPSGIAGFDAEQTLHIAMRRAGHKRLRIGTDNSAGTTYEVFRLNGRSRAEIDAFLMRCFKEFIEHMRSSPPPLPPKPDPLSPLGPALQVRPQAFVRQVEVRREAAGRREQQKSGWRKKSNINAGKAIMLLLLIVVPLAIVLAITSDSATNSKKPPIDASASPTSGKALPRR
jgi:hypothetical protein